MHQNFRIRSSQLWLSIVALLFAGAMALLWTPAQANDSQPINNGVENETKAKGIIQKMPRLLFFGKWEIAGEKYEATLLTRFDQRDGPITEGACVEIRYSENSKPHRLTRVTALEEDECMSDDDDGNDDDGNDDDGNDDDGNDDDGNDDDGNDDDGNDDDGNDDDGNDDDGNDDDDMPQESGTVVVPSAQVYGRISALPDSEDLMGVWGIDEKEYYVNEHTRLKQNHGRYALESCVKVKFGLTQDSLRVATKIETAHDHRCKRNEEQKPYGTLYGVIQSVPSSMIGHSATGALIVQAATNDLTGEYNIGGKTFLADEDTQFKESRKVKIEIGVMAKVTFVIQDDDTYLAKKIQAVRKVPGYDVPGDDDDDGDDDGDDGDDDQDENDGLRGHLFGEIESFPTDLIGVWHVSGITFTTTAETSYIQRVQPFDTGVQVRVNYVVDADGERTAKVVKSLRGNGNGSHKFCGYLNWRPSNGFIGRWLVDNFEGNTDLSTLFDESLGLIGFNSYVEVDYKVDDNGKVTFTNIKAHVPPGAGDNNAIGPISRMVDEDDIQAASIDADQTWNIGDKTYVVTPATEIDESQGALEVGERVTVNSYTAEDGSEVATSISRVSVGTIAPVLFLPAIQ